MQTQIDFQVFLAHTYLELQQNEQAVEIYIGLSGAGLSNSTYIMAQVVSLPLLTFFQTLKIILPRWQ